MSEHDCSGRPPQGRCAPAVAGRLRRSLPRPVAAVISRSRSGRSNGFFGRTKQLNSAQPSCRRMVAQSSVRSRGIVIVKPGGQRGAALLRTGVRLGIGPFAQAGLDEPLSFAVGARGVRPGAFVLEAGSGDRHAEIPAEIGRTVVGHNPFDGDALSPQPVERAREKANRTFLALVWQDLAVAQPGGIVDAHMQGFPADAVMAIDRPRRSPGDAVPDPGNPPELLAVEMDQLAGSL